MNRFVRWSLAAAASALLVACGGGGSDSTPRQSASSVKVFGDSLADVGTFGIKFTVQGAQTRIYPERVAMAYGLSAGCPFFIFNGTGFAANTTVGCTNYAIGGGVINRASSGLSEQDPRTINVQITTATLGGNFAAGDLLLIDGGGNDASALVGAYLKVPADGAAAYRALLGTQLTPDQVIAAVTGGAPGLARAGGLYMTALAGTFYAQIKAGALDKGAQRVVLINLPPITDTPRFQMVLDGIAAASAPNGAAARAQSETLFRGWVAAFNDELARLVAGDARVRIFDAAKAIDDVVAQPAQFSVSNASTPACPITGMGSDGLPTYTFATCTDTALSAAPPTGATGGANWWHSYYFSDGFHPSPYGHQLAFQGIAKVLAEAGWL